MRAGHWREFLEQNFFEVRRFVNSFAESFSTAFKNLHRFFRVDGIDAERRKIYFAHQIEPGSLETERFGSEIVMLNR